VKVLVTVDPQIPVPPKLYGGIERIVDGLVNEMRHKGHTIGLVANAQSEVVVDYMRPWASEDATSRVSHIQNTLTLRKAVNEFRPQLLHSFSRLGYMLPLLPSRLQKLMSYQRHTGGRQIRIANRLAGGSLSFTGCSDFIVQMGRRWGGEWTIIHNFVDTKFYKFNPTVANDAPLVFLSRLERIKGAHTAIAIARATGRRLVIAGNTVDHDEGKDYWRAEIEPHLNRDGIEYVGPVNDEQKRILLSNAAALIVPIEWDEPFGIVFVESLACGTPVISCPRGALPEIIRNGVEGFLVKDVQEGRGAVSNLPKIERSACRKRAEEQFSRKVVVDRYDFLYKQLVNSTRI
jgi:glycosyltransferase involved in cell wall biosynthesis